MAKLTPTRRQLLLTGALGALAVAGCSRDRYSTGADGSTQTVDPGAPRRGGELRVPLTAEPIAPAFDMGTAAAGSVGTAGISTLAYNGLVEVIDGEVVPQLAESWEQASDTRYVFDLRRDVEFTDGTPFDAKAVKANFDRRLAPGSDAVNLPPYLESVKVLGPYQVEFVLERPTATFLASLRRGRTMMMSPTAVEKWAETDPFKASVGTGPYAFASYKAGNEIRLERNDAYFGETNYLDAIVFSILPTVSTQVQAFINGDFDVVGVLPSQVGQVQRRQGMQLHEFTGNTFNYLAFNQTKAPFDNVEVRRAFSAAIDREGIAQGVYSGYALPASGPFSQTIGEAYEDLSEVVAQTFSLDEAQEFLRRSGFDVGTPLDFDTFTQDPWSAEADAMEAQFVELGATVSVHKQDFGSWADQIYTAKDFTMFNSGQTTRTVDPDEVIYPLVHSSGDLNVFGVNDPELDDLLDRARVENDTTTRSDLYREIARKVAEDAHVAFTVFPSEMLATSAHVQGVAFHPGGTHSLESCWLSS